MPFGVYKKDGDFVMYYSACEETLRSHKEDEVLIGIWKTKEEAETVIDGLKKYEKIKLKR
jgi:hypothetical protein